VQLLPYDMAQSLWQEITANKTTSLNYKALYEVEVTYSALPNGQLILEFAIPMVYATFKYVTLIS
jgi:hypothetical protein